MAQGVLKTDEPSTGELVAGILNDVQLLVRHESRLARAELQEEWGKAKQAAVLYTGAGILALGGAMAFLIALVLALHAGTGIPLWMCYGLASVCLLSAALLFFARGRSRARDVDFVPRETVESVKESVGWLKSQI